METTYNLQCKELFQPYSEHITLEKLFSWLLREARKRGIGRDVVELTMAETFVEIAGGKEFSKEGCNCGCGLTNAHSALAHYMRDRMMKLEQKNRARHIEEVEKRIAKRLLKLKTGKKSWIIEFINAWRRVFGN